MDPQAFAHSCPPAASIGVEAVWPLLALVERRQVPLTDLLAPFALETEVVRTSGSRLPMQLLDALWQRGADVTQDPQIGLHACAEISQASFGVLSYLGTVAPNLGQGLRATMANFRLLSDASEYRLEVEERLARVVALQYVLTASPVRQRVEFTIGAMYRYCKEFVLGSFQADDVFFEHPAPPDTSEHRRLFGLAPRFAAGASGFSFAAQWLDCPLRTSDPALAALLQQLADRLLADARRPGTTSGALRALLLQQGLHRPLTLPAAARRLGLSPRNLQRRLLEEQTSYRAVLAELRTACAAQLVTTSDAALAEVCAALGFSDLSTFCRAFKRWTGGSPSAYRRARRSGSQGTSL